jgi:uncharacterized protein YbbC (DUF1343 family)
MYGHPQMEGCSFKFTPRSVAGAKNPPLKDCLCYGVDLRGVDDEKIISEGFNLSYVIDAYNRTKLGEQFFTRFFEKLVGVDYIREMIMAGASAEQIAVLWKDEVEQFKVLRRKYLLYREK